MRRSARIKAAFSGKRTAMRTTRRIRTISNGNQTAIMATTRWMVTDNKAKDRVEAETDADCCELRQHEDCLQRQPDCDKGNDAG